MNDRYYIIIEYYWLLLTVLVMTMKKWWNVWTIIIELLVMTREGHYYYDQMTQWPYYCVTIIDSDDIDNDQCVLMTLKYWMTNEDNIIIIGQWPNYYYYYWQWYW